MDDKTRKEFEAAARATDPGVLLSRAGLGHATSGQYDDGAIEFAWLIWLAARRDTVPAEKVRELMDAVRDWREAGCLTTDLEDEVNRICRSADALAAELQQELKEQDEAGDREQQTDSGDYD